MKGYTANDMEKATGTFRLQLSISGEILILTAAAGVLYLARIWSIDGGLWLAILACALPFSWIVEFAFGEHQAAKTQPRQIQPVRVLLLLLLGLIPAAACCANVLSTANLWLGVGNAKNEHWFLPHAIPSMATWSSTISFQQLIFGEEEYLELVSYFDYAPLFVIPAAAFIYLCFPIIFYRENHFLRIRSLAFLVIVSFASGYWFAKFLPHATKFHSISYVAVSCIINIVAIATLWGTWCWQRNRFSTGKIVLWNLALTTWLFWFSFPFLGG